MGSTANREAEVLTAEDVADDQDAGEPVKKQRPLAIVTERFRAELAGSRAYERPSASLHGRRRRRAGDLSMPDEDDMTAAAAAGGGGGGGGEDDGERGQDGDGPASRGRRERSRSASP
jgi:hypothetical protein